MANISGCQESIARTSRLQNVCEYQQWGISLPGIYAPTGIIDTKVQIQKDFHRQICRKNHFNRQRTVWGASCLALQRRLMRGCVDVLRFRCCCLPVCCVGYELQMCCGLSRPSTGRTVDVAEICALCFWAPALSALLSNWSFGQQCPAINRGSVPHSPPGSFRSFGYRLVSVIKIAQNAQIYD